MYSSGVFCDLEVETIKYDAVLFDLDGVLFDSYQVWDRIVEELLARWEIHFDDLIRETLWSLSMREASAYLVDLIGPPMTLETLEKELTRELREAYSRVGLIEGAKELLSRVRSKGMSIYAVTANHKELALLGLKGNGIFPYFSDVFSSMDVKKGEKDRKFLKKVCQTIHLQPHRLLYIEDNISNLLEATELGISGIYLENSVYQLEESLPSIHVVKQLNDINI